MLITPVTHLTALVLGIQLVKHSRIVNNAVVPHFFTPLLPRVVCY